MIAANGSIDTTEEATVHAQDLDMFVTVQLVEDTPAVLSLENFCEENGYSYGWKGQPPNLIEHCKITPCKCDNFIIIIVVPGRSSEVHLTSSAEDSAENTKDLTPEEQERRKRKKDSATRTPLQVELKECPKPLAMTPVVSKGSPGQPTEDGLQDPAL